MSIVYNLHEPKQFTPSWYLRSKIQAKYFFFTPIKTYKQTHTHRKGAISLQVMDFISYQVIFLYSLCLPICSPTTSLQSHQYHPSCSSQEQDCSDASTSGLPLEFLSSTAPQELPPHLQELHMPDQPWEAKAFR